MKRGAVQRICPVRGSSSPTNVIPGLPDDVALVILARVPRALYGSLRGVCCAWRDALQPSAMIALRNTLQISETLFLFDQDNSIALYEPLLQHLSSPIPYFCDTHCLVAVGGAVGSHVFFLREEYEDSSVDICCFDAASMQWQADSIPLWGKAYSIHLWGKADSIPLWGKPSIMDLASAVVDGHLWLVGGGAEASAARRFDVKSRRWEEMPKMHEGRVEAAAVVLHGCLHVLGGSRVLGGNYVQSGEIWDPRMGAWIHQPELWPAQLSCCPPLVAVVMDTLYAIKDLELVHYMSKSKLWAFSGHLPLEEFACSCGKERYPQLVGAGRELWVVLDCEELETTCTAKILSWVPATGSSPLFWRTVPINSSVKFPPGHVTVCGKVHV